MSNESNETKVKPNQVDVNWQALGGGGGINEFIVTEEIYNKYKIDCQGWMGLNDALDIYVIDTDYESLIDNEDVGEVINLNGYTGCIDGWNFNNKNYTFKNGTIIFDDPIHSGCGLAIGANNSKITFINCIIKAPNCESENNNYAIITLNNSKLNIINCKLEINNRETKTFIITKNPDGEFDINNFSNTINISNSEVKFTTTDGYNPQNIGLTFIRINSLNTRVSLTNNPLIKIWNDEMSNEVENNFIYVDKNSNPEIYLMNNNIDMFCEGGDNGNKLALNLTVDCINTKLINNNFNGTLQARNDSRNNISNLLSEGPHTFQQGDIVWDNSLSPFITDGWLDNNAFIRDNNNYGQEIFLEKMEINPFDSENFEKIYIFKALEIDNERGWIVDFNQDELDNYTKDDLISNEDLLEYGIFCDIDLYDVDMNPEISPTFNITLFFNNNSYSANRNVTVSDLQDFYTKLNDGDFEHKDIYIQEFYNNSFNSHINAPNNFFTNPNASGANSFHHFILNGKGYDRIPETNVYVAEDDDNDLATCLRKMHENNCTILDLNEKWIQCDYDMNNEYCITIRNGGIELFGDETVSLLRMRNCRNVVFENIGFGGNFYASRPDVYDGETMPVFKIENSYDCTFRNCEFGFGYYEQKTIFEIIGGININFVNITGNINAEVPFDENSQEYENYNKEFGCTFIKTHNCDGINIDGNKGPDFVSDHLRIANDLLNDVQEDVNIEQIFIDDRDSKTRYVIKNFILLTHGRNKNDNGWKALIITRDNRDIEIYNCVFHRGTLNVALPKDIPEYEENHEYKHNEEFYNIDDYDNIRIYRVRHDYTSENIESDLQKTTIIDDHEENVLEHNDYYIQYMINTTYSYIPNNQDFWLSRWTTDNKVSTRLWNLSDVDINSEELNDGDILMYNQGFWRKISLQELKDALDNL